MIIHDDNCTRQFLVALVFTDLPSPRNSVLCGDEYESVVMSCGNV